MKTIILLEFAFLSILLSNANAQWTNTILYPDGASATSVKFIDELNGFAAGGYAVFRTTDKGETWISCPIQTQIILNSLSVVSTQNFWVCGNSGAIYKTTDGGDSWIDQSVNISGDLNSIFFIDVNLGFAVSTHGAILKTTNGGNTWDSQTFTANFHDIFFINAQIGWAVSNGIWKTVDGGENWVNTLTIYNNLTSIYFLDENIGFFAGSWVSGTGGGIFKTSDGGSTLNTIYNCVGKLNSINFINYNVGWAVGPYNQILKTTNAGADWESQAPDILATTTEHTSVYFTNENNGYVGPVMFQTNDGGNTWRKQSVQTPTFNGTFALDQNTCWVVGGTKIFKTADAGETWSFTTPEQFPFNSTPSFYGIYFINSLTGWVCGGSGYIFKTTNGGVNWVLQSSFEHRLLRSIFFTDQNNGWACGTDISFNDALLKTTNGGETWIDNDMGTTDDFQSVHFINSNLGWLASDLRLYETTNGGNDWTANAANITSTKSIHFKDENIGWAAGLKMYKTTDAGVNWFEITRPSAYGVTGIYFYNELMGWAGGFEGLFYTNDGGATWSKQDEARVESISFTDQNHGWAVGSMDGFYGYNTKAILRTTNGGATSVDEDKDLFPSNYFLSQNYPNPFNPSTTIKYSVPKIINNQSSIINIKVYDVLGNEIATLVNEQKSSGNYEVSWDASDYSSGIYFCSLKSGNYSSVTKMLLLK